MRAKLRSGTTRFVGAIVGLIAYLLLVLVVSLGGSDPTNNAGMIWFMVGAAFSMPVAVRFLP